MEYVIIIALLFICFNVWASAYNTKQLNDRLNEHLTKSNSLLKEMKEELESLRLIVNNRFEKDENRKHDAYLP
jgi:hypothetical protein